MWYRGTYCILQFSKSQYAPKKNLFEKLFENNYLKKFFSKRNWELMKKLDSFCEKLSGNQVNFSV